MTRRIVWTGVPVREKLNITGRGTVLVVDFEKIKDAYGEEVFDWNDYVEFENDLYQIKKVELLKNDEVIKGINLLVREI